MKLLVLVLAVCCMMIGAGCYAVAGNADFSDISTQRGLLTLHSLCSIGVTFILGKALYSLLPIIKDKPMLQLASYFAAFMLYILFTTACGKNMEKKIARRK